MDQLFIKLAGKLKNKGNKIILSTISKEYTKSKNVKYDIKKKKIWGHGKNTGLLDVFQLKKLLT